MKWHPGVKNKERSRQQHARGNISMHYASVCINESGSSCPFGILRLFVVPVVSLCVGIKEVSDQEEKKKKNRRNNQSVGEASVPRNSKANQK